VSIVTRAIFVAVGLASLVAAFSMTGIQDGIGVSPTKPTYPPTKTARFIVFAMGVSAILAVLFGWG
jgi:hypothetical protein